MSLRGTKRARVTGKSVSPSRMIKQCLGARENPQKREEGNVNRRGDAGDKGKSQDSYR